jgi:tRNA(Ile)-lysidine synthase
VTAEPQFQVPDFEPAALANAIAELLHGLPRPAAGLCVAFSGGLDSTVLLTALARRSGPIALLPLRAVHVDHGLLPQSRQWSRRCVEVSTSLGVPCQLLEVDARAPRGASPEAWARRVRRAAFVAALAADEVLLTAHHADDQLETVLLQLLRGGGPAGIAGMPRIAPLGAGWQARPLLGVMREALRRWADAARLDWIEDPGNRELRFDRNFLRHTVLPALRARWPQAALTVGQSAALTAEAVALAGLAAETDLASVREGRTLPMAALTRLPEPRQRAVLRAWIAGCGLPLPSARTLAALRRDLWRAAPDRVPCARWRDARVYRYRERLYADRETPLPADVARRWPAGEAIAPAAGGRLELRPTTGKGLSRARLPPVLELRPRQGGELFRPSPGAHARPLRKWLQERGVLPWLRDRVPLVYAGETLVAIGDLGYGGEFAARDGEESWLIHWSERPVLTEAEARGTAPGERRAEERRFD